MLNLQQYYKANKRGILKNVRAGSTIPFYIAHIQAQLDARNIEQGGITIDDIALDLYRSF